MVNSVIVWKILRLLLRATWIAMMITAWCTIVVFALVAGLWISSKLEGDTHATQRGCSFRGRVGGRGGLVRLRGRHWLDRHRVVAVVCRRNANRWHCPGDRRGRGRSSDVGV